MTKKFRVGIDVGGTFTDFVVFDQIAGTTRIHKVRTTPDDPSRGILQGIAEIGLAPGDVDGIAHGTTTATNALIERRGAEVAFLTTMGFRDTLRYGEPGGRRCMTPSGRPRLRLCHVATASLSTRGFGGTARSLFRWMRSRSTGWSMRCGRAAFSRWRSVSCILSASGA